MKHPLWSIRRLIPTPLGPVTRPVLFLGQPLNLHGPDEGHVLANARDMGFAGALYAVPLCRECGAAQPSVDWLSRDFVCGRCFSGQMAVSL